jgi:hypothetical protein
MMKATELSSTFDNDFDLIKKFTQQKPFKMTEIELGKDKDLLLIKITGKAKKGAFMQFSGSQVGALEINQPLRGVVRNDQKKYKVY